MSYPTLKLLDDLKKEIQNLVGREISNSFISKILTGQVSRHFESKKTLVKNYAKKGKVYLISTEVLKEYKKNLKIAFEINYNNSNFENIFSNYNQNNTLKEYIRSTINNNPQLNLTYFQVINSKEKAYWLGWIFAEGHINKNGGLQVEIGLKDEILVINFAKAISYEVTNIIYKNRINNNGVEIDTCLITFQNSCFINYLLDKCLVKGKKSRLIKLPEFGDIHIAQVRELYLAFLLGYFDGDGQQGSSRIYSTSYRFLDQIKIKFNLKSKISRQIYITKYGSKRFKYSIFLTADLFNEMLNNFQYSLKRKKIKLVDSVLRAQQLENAREMRNIKFKFTKEELQKLLFEMPKSQIALLHEKKFGITIGRTTVSRYCKHWELEMPPTNYWRKHKYLES